MYFKYAWSILQTISLKKYTSSLYYLDKRSTFEALCTKNHDHMLYCSWDLTHDEYNFYFSFRAFFLSFYSHDSSKNQFFSKNAKKPGDIIILHMCTKKNDQMMHSSWDMVCDRRKERKMDRWTDGYKKWHIKVDAPPKISFLKQQN